MPRRAEPKGPEVVVVSNADPGGRYGSSGIDRPRGRSELTQVVETPFLPTRQRSSIETSECWS
jgi:hypothetical protein